MRPSHALQATLAALVIVASPLMPSGRRVPPGPLDATPLLRPGEALKYTVRSARMGDLGTAELHVQGPDTVAGVRVYQLSFDFSARVALFKVTDRTRSWLRADSLFTVRYTKRERTPLGGRDEDVTVDGRLGQWADGDVRAPLASERPLDELSFIYLIRSLDLEPSESVKLRRHFDVRRNPVVIEAVSRDTVDGRAVVVYTMRVPDARQKQGSSVLRFWISDDAARLPLRIETTMPVAGTITMSLVSAQILPELARK